MINKNKNSKPNLGGSQSYAGVAVAFFIIGVVFLITENTLAIGLPFLALGVTFFILSREKSGGSHKK